METPVRPDELTWSNAANLARALATGLIRFGRLIECRRCSATGHETVTIEVDVEVPQLLTHDIRAIEQFDIVFVAGDSDLPRTVPLRATFPSDVPHINLRAAGNPITLCLYEEQWHEIRRRWTPARFVERLRTWLRLTALGELHASDQPLEPLLTGSAGTIVLPSDFGTHALAGQLPPLRVTSLEGSDSSDVFIALEWTKIDAGSDLECVVVPVLCAPQKHGTIRAKPGTLAGLAGFVMGSGGGDVVTQLIDVIDANRSKVNAFVLFVVACPKQRASDGAVETVETWGFLTAAPVQEVGKAIGRWDVFDGHAVDLIGSKPNLRPENVSLIPLSATFRADPDSVARYSGLPSRKDVRITAIGCGALGSQVELNAIRGGLGCWALIDRDRFLPHNAARHVLGDCDIGAFKAERVAALMNSVTEHHDVATAIVADVLSPANRAGDVNGALRSADIVVDLSASQAVATMLAERDDISVRCVSIFLAPNGADLVVLTEDVHRTTRLDELEVQYLRAVATLPTLAGHLMPPTERVRYGRSCRDVTTELPQERLGLHAAISIRALHQILANPSAQISVWRADPDTLAVRYIPVEVTAVRIFVAGGWTLRVDAGLLASMFAFRATRLPNETGGVLLGSVDLERHVIDIVHMIPSPPDSEEWPTHYIRGSNGLTAAVDAIVTQTSEQLHYVGEWHSHPDGYGCAPSADDFSAFTWIIQHLAAAGLPGAMLIIGDRGVIAPFVGEHAGDFGDIRTMLMAAAKPLEGDGDATSEMALTQCPPGSSLRQAYYSE